MKYKNKIYPGVYIGDTNLGGLSEELAINNINKAIDKINQDGISFNYHTDQAILYPLIASVDGDLAYKIIDFNAEQTAKDAISFGRSDSFINNFLGKAAALFYEYQISLNHTKQDEMIDKFLYDNFSRFETPAESAKLSLENNKKILKFSVEEERYGQVLNFEKAKKDLEKRLYLGSSEPIELAAEINYPLIFKKDVLNIDTKTKNIYLKAPIELKHNYKKWQISRDNLFEWLTLKKEKSTSSEDVDIVVGINNEKVKEYLDENIAPTINQNSVDSKFELKDGKVVEFIASQKGITLDTRATIKKIEHVLSTSNEKIIEIITEEVEPLTTEEIENLGIKEIIGTGHSNFSGSPKNRRHNINIGADSVNGTLIKPGEEFSLLKVLGEIDGSTGYLPELVIKDNKTIPEYGGGLCQIGTTVFRGTTESGLPVTMRRNHSYRVSYYEPAGTDATIYDPWPDYKFKNDTNHHILILSRIDGNDLYFDFWGTKDGRIVEKTDPTIYNITRPPPTKYIETLDLEVGKKRCTEHAHNGADAYFDYTVTYPGTGTTTEPIVKETRFKSHYSPWREVCLIGVEKLSDDKDDNKDNSDTKKLSTSSDSSLWSINN